jgi:monoamine oxidase
VARTPLFHSLRQAIRVAAFAARQDPGGPAVDEIIDMAYSRRRFLRNTAVATAALAAGCSPTPTKEQGTPATPAPPPSSGGPRIVIVGGGMAGLNTAYKLQKAGLRARIFEGSNRTGGRMFTATNAMGEGLTTELGGEFIDSNHEELLSLVDEFGLQRIDTQSPEAKSLIKEAYFFKGQHYTLEQAARAFVPLAERIFKDYDALGEVIDYKEEGGGKKLDRMSMAQYFDSIGATGWMRALLDVAYVTEYGLEAGEQSALNFVNLIGTGDLEDKEAFEILGESDERYKVKGGNERVVQELAKRLESQIQREHRLLAIKSRGEGFTLTFQNGSGSSVVEEADIVVLAIPFTLLREVDMQVEMPPVKKNVIAQLGYGTNAKILVPFKTRPWQKLGYAGNVYTDEPFQLAWDNSFLQPGTAGGLTLYSGGKPGVEVGKGTAEEVAKRLMTGVERVYPDAGRELTEPASKFRPSRMHWPTYPWMKASYSCYKPGQWTTIAGAESLPVGNLYFAGEHCSYDFQGYMNGAAQSGLDTARSVMAKLSGSKAAQSLFRRSARVG